MQLRSKHPFDARVTRVFFRHFAFVINNSHSLKRRMSSLLAPGVRKSLLSDCCQNNLTGVRLHVSNYNAADRRSLDVSYQRPG